MGFDVNNPYFRTKVLTASQEELRLLLIEGSIRFLHEGREGLVAKDYVKSFEGFSQAKSIIIELINALRPQAAPELCKNLSALYTYMYTSLTQAVFDKDFAKIDEVIRLMEYERETWILLLEKIAEEKAQAPSSLALPTAGQAPAAAGAPRAALSVSG
jgi:flagellar protein FliS